MPKVVDNSSLRGSRNTQHVQTKEKGRPAAEIYLQVIGNGANGTSRSLYVFTDQWRYLFNCGEGTQRLAHEYKIKLAKLEHVFFTHSSWDNIGGLPGLILTVQSIGVPKITFHGPKGIADLFEMTKGFLLTDDIEICEKNVEEKNHNDHILKVQYVPLYGGVINRPSVDSSLEKAEIEDNVDDYYDHIDRKRSRSDNKSVGSNTNTNPMKKCRLAVDPNTKDTSVAFICQPTIKPGQLSLEKCLDLGVPPGPLLGQLKDGKDVVLPNGLVVRSQDVVNPPEPSPIFIVLECPTEDFLDGLLEAPEFKMYQKDAVHPDDIAAVVVHFTPSNIVSTEKYQEWLQRFSPSTEHLFLNDNNNSLSSVAVHRIQHQLHLLNSDVFPLLKENYETKTVDSHYNYDGSTHRANNCPTMLRYYLRPFKKSDLNSIASVDPQTFISECSNISGFNDELSKLKTSLSTQKTTLEDVNTSMYPEILFLGTGSSVPSKVRNTSGIFMRTSYDKSILMDCGEGTYIQLYRFFGKDEIDDVLLKLKAIFISHLHADHHIGLIDVLQKRKKAALRRNEPYIPIDLIAPHQIVFWLKRYHELFEPVMEDFRLISNAELLSCNSSKTSEYESLLTKLELDTIVTGYARHCRHAFSVAVTHKNGWKIVYSGDTMPCDAIIAIGKDCDVLIHEATMEDELKSEAFLKKHSTTSEAIEQGVKMNAKFTLLTHFSQRYAKIPRYPDKLTNDVGVAFDNLKVTLADLKILPQLTSALKTLFAEECEDMEEKTAKKLRQMQRMELKATKDFKCSV